MQMFQVLAGEFIGCSVRFNTDGLQQLLLWQLWLPASTVTYRGLVDHPAFNHREARAASKTLDKVPELKDGDIF